MPFVAVPDKNSGDVFTTAMWTQYLEGNLNGGVDRPLYDSGVLAAALSSVDIVSIPATFAHLRLEIHGRGDTAATNINVGLRLNGDSGANYYWQRLRGNGAAASASESLAQTSLQAGFLPAASATAGLGGGITVWIPGYAAGSLSKGMQCKSSCPTGLTTGTIFEDETAGFWNSGAVISRITLTPNAGNFAAGSRITLTGIAYI